MSNLQSRAEIFTLTDEDEFYVDWKDGLVFRSRRINGANFRKLTGIQGDWDMTRGSADTAPDVAFVTEASATENAPHDWDMVPAAGAAQIKMQGSDAPVALPDAARSGRMRVSSASAANLPLHGFLFANQEATQADIATVLFSGTPTGTCTHLAAVYFDIAGIIGPGAMKVYTRIIADGQDAGETLIGAGGIVANDEVYITLNTDASVSVTLNAGAPLTTAAQWDTTGLTGIRLVALGYYASAGTPVGNINFDFSDNTGGRTGFVSVSDPALPAGAANGKRYIVTGAGGFGGKDTAIGDVVELMNAMTEIIVIQASPLTPADVDALVAAYLVANPVIDLLMAARARAVMVTIANDAPAAPFGGFVRGDAVMVGDTATGAFSGFTFGNVAVWETNDTWTEYAPAQFAGVRFMPIDPNLQGYSVAYVDTGASVTFDDGNSVVGYPLNTLKTFGWTFDRIVRTGRKAQAPTITMTNGGTDMVVLDQAEQFVLQAAGGGTYAINWGNSGTVTVTISHTGSGVATITVPNLGFPLYLDGAINVQAELLVNNGAIVAWSISGAKDWNSLNAAYSGAWSDQGGGLQVAEYRRNGDVVEVRGNSANGTAAAILTLPVNSRPPANLVVPVTVIDGTNTVVAARAILGTDGVLSLEQPATPLGDHKVGFNFSFSTLA